MGPIIWFAAAVLLALCETLVLDFSMLTMAGGAAIAAGVALTGAPVWVEVTAFVVSSTLLLLGVRPLLRKRLQAAQSGEAYGHRALSGRTASVVEPVSSENHSGGLVRIDGELWSARAANVGESFAAGETVHVLDIEGNTAVVWRG